MPPARRPLPSAPSAVASMRRLAMVVFLLLGLTPGCGSCRKGSPGSEVEAGAAVLPPLPAPEGVVARVWIRAPDALWGRIQNGVSGAAWLLPSDVGSLLCAATGLDAAIAPLVDAKAASYVVVADGPAGGPELAWAAAVPVRDASRLAAILSPADASAVSEARLDASDGPDPGMQRITRADHPLHAAVAVARGWLVVARNDADLSRLGPYAWRTLPTLAPPLETAAVVAVVDHEALAARLGTAWAVARAWLAERDREERAAHGGRAPDFGDPQAILDAADTVVKRRLGLFAGARDAVLTLDATSDAVVSDLQLQPGEGFDGGPGGLSATSPGDTRPLAEAPGDAVVSLLLRDTEASRADDAREVGAALVRALGPRAHDDDARAIDEALQGWAAARGDWLTASLGWTPARSLTVRSAGGEPASRALRKLALLAKRPVFAAPLGKAFELGALSVGPTHVDGLAGATLASYGGKAAPGLAWGAVGQTLLAVAAEHPEVRLSAQVAAAPPGGHLGDSPRVAQMLADLGADASFVLLAEPLRLVAAPPREGAVRAPAALAWGRRNGRAWLHAGVADELLRQVVLLQSGL